MLILFASSATSWHINVSVPERTAMSLRENLAHDDFHGPAEPSSILSGRDIYANACAYCHGEPETAFITEESPGLNEHSPRDIYQLITWGHSTPQPSGATYTGTAYSPGKDHPAFPVRLSDAERWAVAAYEYSAELDPGTRASDQEWLDAWRERVDGKMDLNPASEMYSALCAPCHGTLGYGNGPLAGDLIPPPRNFRDTSWLASQSDNYLAAIIRAGEADFAADKSWTGMPWWGDYLGEFEVMSLVRYVRGWGYSLDMPGPWEIPGPEETGDTEEGQGGWWQPDSNPWTWDEVRAALPNSPLNPP